MRRGRSIARSPAGFTLAEVLMAIAILGFVVAVLTHAVAAGHTQVHDALHQARALFLAESLMEEIVRLPYADPDDGSTTLGPESGDNQRDRYDNADDYHGYPKTPAIEQSGQLKDLHGTAYPASYQVFSRTVTCQQVTQSVPELGGTLEGLQITVTVTDPDGRSWVLTRFLMDEPEEP